MSLTFTSAELVVPAGTPGAQPIVVDIQAILVSEVRQDEVAIVTPAKAPELLSEFNHSWRELHRLVTGLTSEKNKAEKALAKRKAILLLDEIPKVLAEKGVASAADTRQAVIELDDEYCVLEDTAAQLKAVVELLKGKMKSFENAYSSVKKILGEDPNGMNHRGTNQNLSGDSTAKPRSGWGKTPFSR